MKGSGNREWEHREEGKRGKRSSEESKGRERTIENMN